MSNPKMTDWFPPHLKPVHVGEYNASVQKRADTLRYWDGADWSISYGSRYPSNIRARMMKTKHIGAELIYWRGLASKPEGGKP